MTPTINGNNPSPQRGSSPQMNSSQSHESAEEPRTQESDSSNANPSTYPTNSTCSGNNGKIIAPASANTSVKRPNENRRSNKPIMEKRRRARINNCLNELKTLILDAMKKDPARHSKLEKADILEMTVKHLENLQRQQAVLTAANNPEVTNKFRAGFTECAGEVGKFPGLDLPTKRRLLQHLSNCLSSNDTPTPRKSSENPVPIATVVPLSSTNSLVISNDVKGGNSIENDQTPVQTVPKPASFPAQVPIVSQNRLLLTNGIQLVPTKLPNGDIAFILPSLGQAQNVVFRQVGTVDPIKSERKVVQSVPSTQNGQNIQNGPNIQTEVKNPESSSQYANTVNAMNTSNTPNSNTPLIIPISMANLGLDGMRNFAGKIPLLDVLRHSKNLNASVPNIPNGNVLKLMDQKIPSENSVRKHPEDTREANLVLRSSDQLGTVHYERQLNDLQGVPTLPPGLGRDKKPVFYIHQTKRHLDPERIHDFSDGEMGHGRKYARSLTDRRHSYPTEPYAQSQRYPRDLERVEARIEEFRERDRILNARVPSPLIRRRYSDVRYQPQEFRIQDESFKDSRELYEPFEAREPLNLRPESESYNSYDLSKHTAEAELHEVEDDRRTHRTFLKIPNPYPSFHKNSPRDFSPESPTYYEHPEHAEFYQSTRRSNSPFSERSDSMNSYQQEGYLNQEDVVYDYSPYCPSERSYSPGPLSLVVKKAGDDQGDHWRPW